MATKTTTTLKFDEINKPLSYREFFGKMYISKKQMDERIALAKDIESVMLYIFAYWLIRDDLGISTQEIKDLAKGQLKAVYERYTKFDGYIENRVDKTIDEIIDVTERHTAIQQENADFDLVNSNENAPAGYWTSGDRAMIIAENEANSLANYAEYRTAKAQGKTKKRWLTELDDKVRFTHTLEEGKTVDIDGLFLVGNSLMRFPRDYEYDPEPDEVINCRCACVYE